MNSVSESETGAASGRGEGHEAQTGGGTEEGWLERTSPAHTMLFSWTV